MSPVGRRLQVRFGAVGLLLLLACAVGGGAVPPPAERTARAYALARAGGFIPLRDRAHEVEGFDVRDDARTTGAVELPVSVWIRPGSTAGCARVYLEGDGLAWRSRYRHAEDPTPVDPVALRLALADPSGDTIVYLGRPCQYVDSTDPAWSASCRPILWTNARYGEAVVAALDRHLDALAESQGLTRLRLIGYSGGGVLAALLAARRDDIVSIATIAAPLDLEAWTSRAGVTPLVLSIDPMTEIERLRGVAQDHFVGALDEVVPADVSLGFVRALGAGAPAVVHTVPGIGHTGWPEIWASRASEIGQACDPESIAP